MGTLLASKYRLEALLGSGGMGDVYRAVNQDVGRRVAIKVLRAEHAEDPQVVERFLREARAANLVRHPNVVDVLDVGREDGVPFIVQELLDGEDLSQLVARRGGKLPVAEVITILIPVIDAVAEAHAQGVIHRDLKPENVFLATSRNGPVPKLLDFGISKMSASDLRPTAAGVLMGTPAYMPPEQMNGAAVDARSDVWAFGVMIFELTSGRMPFEGEDAASVFLAVLNREPPRLLDVAPELGDELSRIVERCLRRTPADRYPTAAELARDLRHLLAGTDLEPTGRHSLPPPRSAPTDPELAAPPSVRLPETPSLAPPAPRVRSAPPFTAALAPSAPRSGPVPAAPSSGSDLGQMHAVPSSRSGAPRGPSGRPAQRPAGAPATSSVETTTLVGAAVVLVVVAFGVGVMTQLAHRTEGWPVARFLLGPGALGELLVHGLLGLLLVAAGAGCCWRGVRYWRGDLAGGAPNTLFNAAFAALAFFCAFELLTAVM